MRLHCGCTIGQLLHIHQVEVYLVLGILGNLPALILILQKRIFERGRYGEDIHVYPRLTPDVKAQGTGPGRKWCPSQCLGLLPGTSIVTTPLPTIVASAHIVRSAQRRSCTVAKNEKTLLAEWPHKK